MDPETLRGVFDYIDSHFEEFVDDLREYCSVPTISALREGFREGAGATRRLLEQHAVRTRELPVPKGPPLVVGESGGDGGPLLILYNHYDVQPVDPLDEWATDPFNPTVREGRLFARGVADTKGNVLSQALAQRAIRETMGDLPLRLRFMVEGEEEVGSPHFPDFWREHQDLFKGDGATIEGAGHAVDGTPTITLGSKGILYVELSVRTAKIDQHSSLAASLPNPAWRLMSALRTIRNERGRILLPGFYDGAHKPTEEELAYLRRNRFDPLDLKEAYGAREVLGGKTRLSRLKQLVYGNTCNIDGFYSGYIGEGTKTINPAFAKVKLDFRLLPGQRPAEVLESLKEHLRSRGFEDVRVECLGSFEPAATPLSSRIGQSLLAACEEVYDREPNIFPWSAGSSSTWYYTSVGTPSAAAPGVGYTGSKVHAPNEHIRLDDARRAVKATAAMMLAFAGQN
jgi:acetylornithine deacetylase/succinyl-diaminopimelate desuccinylase-like protein